MTKIQSNKYIKQTNSATVTISFLSFSLQSANNSFAYTKPTGLAGLR